MKSLRVLSLFIVIALFLAPPAWADWYSYISTLGVANEPGADNSHLNYPYGAAVDGSGNFYVVDNANSRVQKFDSSGVYQSTLGESGVPGTDNGHFKQPFGVAVDGPGNVYVADTGNQRIQIFNSSGVYESTLGITGVSDIDNNHFNWPYSVAVDGPGNVYVADYLNSRVQIFNSTGAYQGTLGITNVSGADNSHFNQPSGVAVDHSGNIYVSDCNNQRVQIFNSSGVYQSTLGIATVSGADNAHFNQPFGLAVDGADWLYVADSGNERIQVFDSNGIYQNTIGSNGAGTDFNGPYDVSVQGYGDSSKVYVSDLLNNRVQKFYLVDHTPPTTIANAAGYVMGDWSSEGTISVTLTSIDGVNGPINVPGYPAYCVDITNTCDPGTAYTVPVEVTCPSDSVCTQYIRYYARDSAGNIEGAKSSVVYQDLQPPVTTATPVEYAFGDISNSLSILVTLSGDDGTGSGLAAGYPKYCVDSADTCTPGITYEGALNVTCPAGTACTQHLRYLSMDIAGNAESVRSSAVNQTTAPEGSIAINSGAGFTNSLSATLTLSCTASDACSQMQFSTDGITYQTPVAYAAAKPWTLSPANGPQTVYAMVSDAAGGWSAPFSASIVYDNVAPAGGILNATAGDRQVSLSWTNTVDATSGVALYKIAYAVGPKAPANCSAAFANATDASYTHTPLANLTQYSYRVCGVDRAGNVSLGSTATATPIEHVLPVGTVSINNGAAYTKSTSVTLNLYATDDVAVKGYYRSTKATPPGKKTKWTAVPATTILNATVSQKLAGKSGTDYVYVWFKDSSNNISEMASDTIIYDKTAPSNGTVTATAGDGSVRLDWSGFSDALSNIAGYKVAYAAGKKAPKTCSAAQGSTTGTEYTQGTLTNNTLYSFRVCAVDGAGNVSKGATKSATPAASIGGGPHSVTGTAALGAPIPGETVTLVDSTGASVTGTTAQDGSFSIDATGLTPPFLLSVTSGDTTLYSVSADMNSSTTVNLTPLTDLIVSTWYGVQGTSPAAAFSDPASNPAPSPTEVKVIGTVVENLMSSALQAAGLDNTGGFSPITTPFAADGTGIDGVLDDTTVTTDPGGAGAESLNNSTTTPFAAGIVNTSTTYLIVNTPGGIVNSTITTFDSGIVNTSTTQTTDNGTTSPMSGNTTLPTTAGQGSALGLINTAISNFVNVINQKGSDLTIANIAPYVDPAYMDNGENATQWESGVVSDLKGATLAFTGLQLDSLGSDTADVSFQLYMSKGGESGTQSIKTGFKLIGGSWLISGNHRAAGAIVTTWAWDQASYGFSNNVRFEVDDPQAIVQSVTATGPGLSGDVTVPMVCDNGGTDGLPSCGNAFGDNSQRAFQLDDSFWPAIGSQYTYTLTTAGGPVQYGSTIIAAYGFDAEGTPVLADFPSMSGAIVSSPPGLSQIMSGTTVHGSVYVPIWVKGNADAPHFNYEGPGGSNNNATTVLIDGSWVSGSAIPGQVNAFTITIPAATVNGPVDCGGNACYNITFQGQGGDIEGGWVGMDACFQDQSSCTNSGVELQ